MKHTRIISAVMAAAMLTTLTACQTEETPGDSSSGAVPAAGVAVQVQQVTADTIATGNNVSGRVVNDSGRESVFVSANAKCTDVYVEEGDEIQAGAPLCHLDMTDTLSSLETATTNYNNALKSYQDQEALFDAQIALAEKTVSDTMKSYQDQEALFDAQIALAEKNVRDLKALLEIGAAAQAEIDQAELNLQNLQTSKSSALTQLEAGIQNAQTNIQSLQVSKTSALTQLETGMQTTQISIDQLHTVLENVDSRGNVIAPISGTILSLNAAENSFVGPTAPVAVIDGVARMEISVSVSEALIPRLRLGDEMDVTISALNTTVTGTITEIQDEANPQTKLYDVAIRIKEDLEGLRSGMFVDVSFRTDVSTNAIVIPTQAILTSNNLQYVFVVDGASEDTGTARYVSISTGLTGNGVTEVTAGLSAGDLLVTVGQSYLSDGDPVRIVSGEG